MYIENVGDFKDGASVWMPSGASVRYKAYVSTEKVDCTALAPSYCVIGIQLGDPYEWINIQNVGWYEDGESVWMPATATFYYYTYDANKQNPTGRLSKAVDCSDLVYPTTYRAERTTSLSTWREVAPPLSSLRSAVGKLHHLNC